MHVRVHHHLPYGSSLLITGSSLHLGSWDPAKALSLKWTPDHIWTIHLPHTTNPTRFEFKFLIKANDSITWEPSTNHALVIPPHTSQTAFITPSFASPREHSPSPNPPSPPSPTPTPLSTNGPTTQLLESVANGLAIRKTLTFRVAIPPDEYNVTVYVAGSHPALGSWNKMNAPRLLKSSNVYELSLDINASQTFQYKYFIRRTDQTRRWETGPNRVAHPEHGLLLDDRWDKIRISFSIFYPPPNPSHIMHITGDLDEIGAWYRPGPIPMTLGPVQKLETDVMGRKWLLNIWVSPKTQSFSYRYILIDKSSRHELWEREPNRRAELAPEEVLINSALEQRDVNFVSNLMFDHVPPNMFIGPYPQSVSDVDAMAEAGVTGVFNVQTDEDFKHRAIQWDILTARYNEHDIKVIRFPIRDFDKDSLRQKLRSATHALHDLLDEGRQVYIHCTAGMGRAPACAVAYLCWVKKMQLDDAVAFVKKHRKVAVPNVLVLEEALKEPY